MGAVGSQWAMGCQGVPALRGLGSPMSNGVLGGSQVWGCGLSPALLRHWGAAEPPTEWEFPFLPRELWVRKLPGAAPASVSPLAEPCQVTLLGPPPVAAPRVAGPGAWLGWWVGTGWANSGCDRCDSLGTVLGCRTVPQDTVPGSPGCREPWKPHKGQTGQVLVLHPGWDIPWNQSRLGHPPGSIRAGA